jgi:hypothetical protein
MDKTLRMILAGIMAGFILFLAVSVVYKITGNISDPSISKLFRETISMQWFYKILLLNVGTGLIMAITFAMLFNALPGGALFKGIFWGFIMWVIMVHQPMIMILVAGKFTADLLLTWVVQGLTSYVAAGISIGLIYKQ